MGFGIGKRSKALMEGKPLGVWISHLDINLNLTGHIHINKSIYTSYASCPLPESAINDD